MFAALCEMPEFFRERLSLFIALAPVARVDHITSGIIQDASKQNEVVETMTKLQIDEIMPGKENNH